MEAVLGTISDVMESSASTHHLRLWTREDYYRMAEAGVLGPDEKTELIAGEIIKKVSPQRRPHATAMFKAVRALEDVFSQGFYISTQLPLVLDNFSEPEPDVMVVVGNFEDYPDEHPTAQDVRLVIEASDMTLAFDRKRKAPLYASAGIADYWIININERLLEMYRDPSPTAGYQTVTRYSETESVTPLASPTHIVKVADLLP